MYAAGTQRKRKIGRWNGNGLAIKNRPKRVEDQKMSNGRGEAPGEEGLIQNVRTSHAYQVEEDEPHRERNEHDDAAETKFLLQNVRVADVS